MTIDLLAALVMFAFVASITPGPNTMMLLASGANFGFRRTVPHMLGVGIGFSVMIAVMGIGAAQAFAAIPNSETLLQILSVGYLLWLAWKIATATQPHGETAGARPFSFLQAAGFQWVNPKAWAVALSAISVYAPGHDLLATGTVTLVFAAVSLPAVTSWTVLGREIRQFLHGPARLRVFNWSMAGLLVASLLPVFRH